MAFPLLIEFVRGTRVYQQRGVAGRLPIVRNGPPSTFVVFPDGARVSLPTDQIVFADDRRGLALVGFCGMRMGAMDHGRLVFHRVKDLRPEEELSPERARRMTLQPRMVSSIAVDGHAVWPLQ
jgi:hypothetical protein